MVVGGSGDRVLREDFCGTGLVSLHWLLLFRKAKVVMVNDAAEPITFRAALNGWSRGELASKAKLSG
ncbi:hypothetical protein DIPPA_26533 [Diplonema papillatum]|nr:hypothetical protein DIPPA_26533 [Diplonema papillatum]